MEDGQARQSRPWLVPPSYPFSFYWIINDRDSLLPFCKDPARQLWPRVRLVLLFLVSSSFKFLNTPADFYSSLRFCSLFSFLALYTQSFFSIVVSSLLLLKSKIVILGVRGCGARAFFLFQQTARVKYVWYNSFFLRQITERLWDKVEWWWGRDENTTVAGTTTLV